MEEQTTIGTVHASTHNPCSPSHPRPVPSMPLVGSASHSYLPQSGSATQYNTSISWAPPPSPYAYDNAKQASGVAQSSHPSYPVSARGQQYGLGTPCSWDGSLSAPGRSPHDCQPPLHPLSPNGYLPKDAHTFHQRLPDFRQKGGHRIDETTSDDSHPSIHHAIVPDVTMTGQDLMPSGGSYPPPLPSVGPHHSQIIPLRGEHCIAYYPPPLGPYNLQRQPRKPVRAQQACDTCRTKKAKCDEQRPCSHCKDNGLHCSYRDVPALKQDRHALAMEAKFDQMQAELTEKLTAMDKR
jgi:Fungal Zn(2)-Cys(6) binuclear cluster domain